MCTCLCFQQHLRCQKVWSGWSWTIKTQVSTSSTIKTRTGPHLERLYSEMSAFSRRRTVPHSYTTSLLFQSQYILFRQVMFDSPILYLRTSLEWSVCRFMSPLWYQQIWTRFLPSRAKSVGLHVQWNWNLSRDRGFVPAQQHLQAAWQKTVSRSCVPHEGTVKLVQQ